MNIDDNNVIIVSMTSYPKRIKYVAKVFYSILNQSLSKEHYHCVLTLSTEEFPNKLNDLPEDLKLMIELNLIEIIWCEKNIYSHKKLMHVIKKYKNNPILVTDDDVYRQYNWIEGFYNDYLKYPSDVITGSVRFRLIDGHFKNVEIKDEEIGTIIKNGRPANGFGGTLYPPNIFTDYEFFNENLYMKYTPFSDESWQFYFLYKNNANIRIVSNYDKKYDRNSPLSIGEAQQDCLWEKNRNKYDNIWKALNENIKIKKNQQIIISLTTYKNRFKYIKNSVQSIINNTYKNIKICITLYIEDYNKLPDDLKLFIKDNNIEIIVSNIDLGPHLKYFYVMQKYKSNIVITIDDDIEYDKDMIKNMLSFYYSDDVIIANRCHKIDKNNIFNYKKYIKNYDKVCEDDMLLATGVGGILYPPGCIPVNESMIKDILNNCKYQDDIFLKAMEIKYHIKILNINNINYNELVFENKTNLYNENVFNNKNDVALKNMKRYFLQLKTN